MVYHISSYITQYDPVYPNAIHLRPPGNIPVAMRCHASRYRPLVIHIEIIHSYVAADLAFNVPFSKDCFGEHLEFMPRKTWTTLGQKLDQYWHFWDPLQPITWKQNQKKWARTILLLDLESLLDSILSLDISRVELLLDIEFITGLVEGNNFSRPLLPLKHGRFQFEIWSTLKHLESIQCEVRQGRSLFAIAVSRHKLPPELVEGKSAGELS